MRGLGSSYKLFPFWKNINHIYIVTFITILCSTSYILEVWQRGKSGTTTSATIVPTSKDKYTGPVSGSLDVSAHHAAVDNPSMSSRSGLLARAYPACNANYSEYTPCEDPQRSSKLKGTRLMNMERHCPAKTELLKCRVPAPYGYKSPFKWPVSRDYAWYNNVPHKELTVKKADQNWIRFEGDRFKFPGGGTMFPNGADAYIDDIAKLINLEDGSIRTAIDTGCGVASWGSFLLSRNILTMSFAPRDAHEAQVQFALERGVPALIGVMATKRLPYPSRSFDMAHCSRCLIPWDKYGNVKFEYS